MNTKLLLTTTAVVLAAGGILGTFGPAEILVASGLPATQPLPLFLQILAALLFGFAMLNWLARGSLLGGIYNRPLALANVAHFTIGGFALLRQVTAGGRHPALLAVTAFYIVSAVAFAMAMQKSPVKPPRREVDH